jgi:hypothetical protein
MGNMMMMMMMIDSATLTAVGSGWGWCYFWGVAGLWQRSSDCAQLRWCG